MCSVPTLGYFKTRGLAQPIRLLLKYAGVHFNDKLYEFGPYDGLSLVDVDSVKKYWLFDKLSLGLDFPNVPYYIDGDLKLTQSLTILKYLGQKYGLMATDEDSLIRQDLIEQQIIDLWAAFHLIVNKSNNNLTEQKKIEDIDPELEQLSKFLGKNKWLVRKLTYVDFLAYEVLDCIRLFAPSAFDNLPLLKHYLLRFENMEPIRKYMSSPEFLSWPTTGPFHKWGFHK